MRRELLIRSAIAQIVSLVLSWVLVRFVFLGPTPYIRASLKSDIASLPSSASVVAHRAVDATRARLGLIPHASIGLKPGAPSHSESSPFFPSVPPVDHHDSISPTSQKTPPPQPTTHVPSPTNPLHPQPTRTAPQPTHTFPTRGPLPTITSQPTSVPSPTTQPSLPPTSLSTHEQALLDRINANRRTLGLSDLTAHSSLMKAARDASSDVASTYTGTRQCGHVGNFVTRAQSAGFGGELVGEAVACMHTTAESAVDSQYGWMHSPPHRAIIMSAGAHYIGLGWTGEYQAAIVGY